jgi:hypothetical protein
MNANEEKTLRESIRHAIRVVKQKRHNIVKEQEDKLREIIRGFVAIEEEAITESSTPDVDPTPNKSTGINVLEQLLKKIVPILEEDYKSLTTNESQRESYRSHIINAVENSLTPAMMNNVAGDSESDLEEVIDIDVGGSADDDKFIDIRTNAEKSADDEEEEKDPRDSFGKDVEGDETGRNMAYESYKKIETNVIDAYELLSDPEDQELFYDYLIANLKLYFNKFEEELAPEVPEPSNKAYDMAQTDPSMPSSDSDEGDIELDL